MCPNFIQAGCRMNDEHKQRPEWLRVKNFGGAEYQKIRALLKSRKLNTVCQEANCPNRGECFSSGTATFLILGSNCTRNCTFCNVTHGRPFEIDAEEPARLAETVAILKLKHVVITSVTRDDLPDGGAGQFVEVIRKIRDISRNISIEVLTPDFAGNSQSALAVLAEYPDVFNHNVETVPRLYQTVRPQAVYQRSLHLLKSAAEFGGPTVKSGLMVGLGESEDELRQVFKDLAVAGVTCLTLGQYLAPSGNHHKIIKYYHPSEFETLAGDARHAGIAHVFAAPLVRSSYHAAGQLHKA